MVLCVSSILMAGGCKPGGSAAPPAPEPGVLVQAIGCTPESTSRDCTQSNGNGIYISRTEPAGRYGLASSDWWTFYLMGFINRIDNQVIARGWHEVNGAIVVVDSQVVGAIYQGTTVTLRSLGVRKTYLGARILDAQGQEMELSGDSLKELVLLVTDSEPGHLPITYELRFSEALRMDGALGTFGYRMDYRPTTLQGAPRISYCQRPVAGGTAYEDMATVFHQGAHWSPTDATRTDGDELISVSCESGAIATCMRWGYAPWRTASRAQGEPESLVPYHQACLHLKRAAYCGGGTSYTKNDTRIIVVDPFEPPIQNRSVDRIEAAWSPQQGLCLTEQRRKDIPLNGCALPACDAQTMSGWYLISGLPSP
jgi:hypothetical protein